MGFLSGLFTMPGTSAANNAMSQEQALAGSQAAVYNKYIPGAMTQLQQLSLNGNNPTIQANLNQTNAQAGSAASNALGMLDANYGQRGIGQSSYTNNAASAIGANYMGQVAQNNQTSAETQQRIQMQALMQMLGIAGNSGQSAQSGYGQVSQMADQQSQAANSALGGLGSFLGSSTGGQMLSGLGGLASTALGSIGL